MIEIKESRIYAGFFCFISGSILVSRFDSFLAFSDIQKGNIFQNIIITETTRTEERKLNMETYKTKRSILGDQSTH